MNGNVADRMLQLLSSHRTWSHGFLFAGPHRCLMGARLVISGKNFLVGYSPFEGKRWALAMNDDPYTVMLAGIIAEQFPERLTCLSGKAATAPQEIIAFNDYYATRYTDIRLVLEKAAVAWEEKNGH